MITLHDGGYRIRQYYIENRRKLQPRYTPSPRDEGLWNSISDFVSGKGFDLKVFVDAAFNMCPVGRFPFANMLKSEKSIAWYKSYENNILRADSQAVQASPDTSTPNLRLAQLRNDHHSYVRYVKQLTQRQPSIKKVLMDELLPLASWFRIIYLVPLDDEIRQTYMKHALQEIRQNGVLQKFLQEELKIDVRAIFYE